MGKEVKVSVVFIIDNVDSAYQLGIRSILNQTFSLFEIIVMDLTNSNEISNVINDISDDRIRYIKTSYEFNELFNLGILQSKGEYISFFEAGCIMNKDKLKKQYDYLENHYEADCVYTGVKFHEYCNFKTENNFSSNELIHATIFCNPVFFSSLLFRKSSLLKRKLPSDLYKGNDMYLNSYVLLVNMIMNDFSIRFLDESLVSCKLKQKVLGSYFNLQMKIIQAQYLNYISAQIVSSYNGTVDDINKFISLFENGSIDFDSLKLKIATLYKSKFTQSGSSGSKKRLLFCIPNLSYGGAEKQLITFLENIDYRYNEVDLLIFKRYGVYLKDIPEEVNWYTLDYFEQYSIKEYDVEVAFLEGIATKFIANRKTDAKKYAWVRIDLYNFHYTGVFYTDLQEEISCYLKFDKILFNSKDTLERFTDRFGDIPVSKSVIYNLIDKQKILRLSDEYSVEKNIEVTLCSIGRLDTQKRYDRLLHILNDLKNEGLRFHLWIIGEGSLRASLEEMIIELSLEDNITLLGFCYNPYPYLKGCDMFVQASMAEGFSNVVAEAICLGKPILATDTAGPSELLGHGEFGYIVKNDYGEINKALRILLINKNLRVDLSKKSLERSSIFDIRKRMKEIMDVLN